MRVALTHALGRLEGLIEALEALGVEAVHAPLIAQSVRDDTATTAAARALLALPWRCYPSRSAVEAWTSLGLPLDDGSRLAAVGPGTARALRAAGAGEVLTPPAAASTAAGLARALLAAGAAGQPVGLVQGSNARPELGRRLREGGAEPRPVTVYDVAALPWGVLGAVDRVLLASPSAVAALPSAVASQTRLVALGPTTAAAIEARGWSCSRAEAPTVAAVVAALCRDAPSRPRPRDAAEVRP